MPQYHYHSASTLGRFAFYWRQIQRDYGYANIASHHVLGAVLKLAVVFYFILGSVFLTLRYAVMPNIDRYKGNVEQMATRAIGRPVTIDTIYATWEGLRPHLFLGGVVIHDQNGRDALKLPGVAATFSWWTLVAAQVRLYSLEVSRPDLDIQRDADGHLFVAGIFIDRNKSDDGKGLDWILAQREMVIRDGRVRWNDDRRKAPELALEGVDLLIRNGWQNHRFALRATPPALLAAPLDVRADFDHPFFARRISDVTKWKGELYADLRNTDLTAWKPYFDYPVELRQGQGAVRAWLNFDHAKVADFTADLSLANVSTRLRTDLQPLNLQQANGRISVRESFDPDSAGGMAGFGAEGHSISLTNFTMQTDDGLVMPATTISETYVPGKNGQPEKTEINARSLDLRPLADFIERLPLAKAQRQILVDFAPSGQLKDFSAQWQGAYPDISSYNVKGQFIGLSLKAQPSRPARPRIGKLAAQAAVPAIPGFENLTGQVDANDHGGTFNLASERLTLNLSGYFIDPAMSFNRLNMKAGWKFQGTDQLLLDVASMDFVQDGLSASLSGTHLMPMAPSHGKPTGTIDLTGHISRFEINQIGRYLPTATHEHLRDWLTGALEGGTAHDLTVRLKGDMAQFPFHGEAANENSKGQFSIAGKIENGKLNYLPNKFADDGKTPLWPEMEEINGTIAFDNMRLEINADSAKTHGVGISNVKASIPDLLSHDIVLDIDGSAAGPLQDFVGYTIDSPVGDLIGHLTDETKAAGNAKLALKLQLPLMHILDTKAQGTLQFAGNDVTLQNVIPPFLATTGKLEFSERGLGQSSLKANLLGGPITISGGSQRDVTLIKAEGSITAAGLRKNYPAPAMQRLVDHISGSTHYSASISVKKKQRPEIIIESNTQGIALDFPAPLRKAANDSLSLRIERIGLSSDDASSPRDELKLALGPAISARYLLQKPPEKNAAWRVVQGGIGVNEPAPQPESGLTVNVNMKSLNIDQWNRTVSSITGSERQKAAVASGASDAAELLQYIEPDVLAARAIELIVLDKKLDNVVVGASHQKGVWQANIDSEQASGYLTWNEESGVQTSGKVTARLASLIIPKAAASDVTDLLEGKNTSAQIPGLDIVADNFELYGNKLGRLELIANNIPASATREWRINKLSLMNPDAELKATGKWTSKDGENLSSLNYALDIGNAGKLLGRFGFASVLRGGKGKMDGNISWKGLPFAFDIPSLSGQIKMDVASGQYLKVDLGAGKLLGVLSLQGLPRLGDVFSEGFAFDTIAATATIVQGVARTDNFKMRSVNATVLIDGAVDIAKETQNLHAVIIPDYNLGTASAVYALAVNPVIGVGTFLAQLFLREPLARALTVEYRITGPWKDPVSAKIERRAERVPKAPDTTTDSANNAG